MSPGRPGSSATPRVDDKIVAALGLSRVIEPVWHVGLEVDGVTALQEMLFLAEDGPQPPPLHDHVLVHTPAARRELARGRAPRHHVPRELNPAEARREH